MINTMLGVFCLALSIINAVNYMTNHSLVTYVVYGFCAFGAGVCFMAALAGR